MSTKKPRRSSRSATATRSSAPWISGAPRSRRHLALRAEAVDGRASKALRNQWLSLKPGITIGTSVAPGSASASQSSIALGTAGESSRRAVADDRLDELELVARRRSPSTASTRSRDLGPAHPRRHAAVDQDLGARGDHVLLLGGARPSSAPASPRASARRGRRRAAGSSAREPLERRRQRVVVGVDLLADQRREEGARPRASARAAAASRSRSSSGRQLQQRVVARCPAPRRGRRAPRVRSVKRKTPFSPTQSGVEAPPVELERDAAALVEHVVGAHLVGVLLAQPLRAVGRARLLVGGDDDQQLALARAASRSRPSARPRRPRRRPGPSCPARRGPRPRRPRRRPPTGRSSTRTGRRDRVDVAEQAQRRPGAVAAAAARPGSGARARRPSSSHSKPASASSVAAAAPAPARSLPGGLTVSIRISRCSSSTAVAPSCDRVRDGGLSPSRPGYPPTRPPAGDRAALGQRRILRAHGAAVRHRRGRRRAAPASRPTEAPLAVRMRPRDARRAGRAGAPARRGLGAARGDRDRRAAQRDLLRAARARARRRWRGSSPPRAARRLRGGVGGQRRPRRGPRA